MLALRAKHISVTVFTALLIVHCLQCKAADSLGEFVTLSQSLHGYILQYHSYQCIAVLAFLTGCAYGQSDSRLASTCKINAEQLDRQF